MKIIRAHRCDSCGKGFWTWEGFVRHIEACFGPRWGQR